MGPKWIELFIPIVRQGYTSNSWLGNQECNVYTKYSFWYSVHPKYYTNCHILPLMYTSDLKGRISHSLSWRPVIYTKTIKGGSVYVWVVDHNLPHYTVGIFWVFVRLALDGANSSTFAAIAKAPRSRSHNLLAYQADKCSIFGSVWRARL